MEWNFKIVTREPLKYDVMETYLESHHCQIIIIYVSWLLPFKIILAVCCFFFKDNKPLKLQFLDQTTSSKMHKIFKLGKTEKFDDKSRQKETEG